MSKRIKLTLQYDGSAYNGWQVQTTGITIQGVIEDCIYRLTGEKASVIGAGRTDAGVHAIEQIAAFDSQSRLDINVIKRALNALLPPDIRVIKIKEVERDFNPRQSARSKRYSYVIANIRDVPVFVQKYVWWIKAPLDVEAMRAASAHLLGSHDFSSFRGSACGAKNPVKKVFFLEIERFHDAIFIFTRFQGDFIIISFEADAFLRHMVRSIVGTLVEVGIKRITPEAVKKILESKDRRLAGPTAPPSGLFLEKVIY